MDMDQAMERVMDTLFGRGYISPGAAQVYQETMRLLELIRPEELEEAAERLVLIGVAIQQDAVQ